MLSTNVMHKTSNVTSFSEWLDRLAVRDKVTAADLEDCRAAVGNRYPEMVLWLARAEKLRPKVLADAAYTAWLATENPKKSMPASDWADLFRLSYLAGHALFEVPELN